jgi:hypothetical protein
MTYFGQPDSYSNSLEIINIVLAIIFFVEMLIKLVGLGITEYFSSRWNILDFVIVVGSSVGLIKTAPLLDCGSPCFLKKELYLLSMCFVFVCIFPRVIN